MFRPLLTAAGAVSLLVLVACDTRPRPRESASAYAVPTDTAAHTLLGTQLQAQPLIPAVRDQLRRFARQPRERREENLTSYKQQLAALTSGMQADIQRLGGSNMDAIRALSDSVTDDLGGGTGKARGLADADSTEFQRHIDRVDRMIGLYEATVRESADRTHR